ncbi:MAG TPA: RsmB/NOP family class I SAM-dependent RNA methyltransferase [Rhizomicrobium sp.]|jgi:16S rRNA (cytosine967-C5)-methyltransferase
MNPSARIQAAIDIVTALETSRLPADRSLREYFRARRYAGSKDRAAVGERVFDIFRHRAAYGWRMSGMSPRLLAMASLLREGLGEEAVSGLFSGGYGPAPLTDEERAAVITPPTEAMPLSVQGEFPEFLEAELTRAFGDRLLDEMAAMQIRAPIDLRVNSLKATREGVVDVLRHEGYEAEPTLWSPWGVRLPAGASGLERTALFLSGAFEFQDEAAQVAVMLCGAKPAKRVLDLAAGAGGKTLALAATMSNLGEITAHDIDEGRLRQIGPRADRAGIAIVQTHVGPMPPKRPYDLVLLDAPCSGSGTWRRQPENKWRLTLERLDELNALQDKLLDQAAARAAGSARVVYATCSVLPRENEDRITAFLSRHPNFELIPARSAWSESATPPGLDEFFRASPLSTGTDGFFTAILQRRAA